MSPSRNVSVATNCYIAGYGGMPQDRDGDRPTMRRPGSVRDHAAPAAGNAKEAAMPLFLIERNFAEEVMLDDADAAQIRQINDEIGIQWLYSFLSADKRKTYCLYEAPNAEAIRVAARRLTIPADVIIAVSEMRPEQFGAGAMAG
jgi:hypothetical protein